MACAAISTIESIPDLLVWPTGCFYYFWLLMFGILFAIIAFGIFRKEQNRKTEGDLISSMGVSSIGISFLSAIGTMVKNGDNIPMVQSDILLYVISVTIVILLVWKFKK